MASREQPWMRPIVEPGVQPGYRTGPPDFVGVGAQRAGTSWWWRGAIRSHPGFVRDVKPGKELHFFDRFWDGREIPGDLPERYARQFPRPEGAITGEFTPRYMHDVWALPLLKRCAPEAKILVLLRDPLERYRSGITREARMAAEGGWPMDIGIVGDGVHRSLYSRQLERLFELFDRERVLVLQYERCIADPMGEMQRTHRFLGLEPLTEMPEKLERQAGPARDKEELDPLLRAELVASLAGDARRTAELCDEIDLSLWPSVG